jgi:hypothetical protein
MSGAIRLSNICAWCEKLSPFTSWANWCQYHTKLFSPL